MHRYSTFVNWELWWPQFPILVYFKETQTKPEGQIHFFPVIFVSTNLALKSKKNVSRYHGIQPNVMSRMANNSMMSWWSALGPQRRAALSSADLPSRWWAEFHGVLWHQLTLQHEAKAPCLFQPTWVLTCVPPIALCITFKIKWMDEASICFFCRYIRNWCNATSTTHLRQYIGI